MQGPVTKWTSEYIDKYKKFKSVKQVILSTWIDQSVAECNADTTIQSHYPDYAGKGNRNLQIASSIKGVRESDSHYVLKVRSDMFLPQLEKMLEWYRDNATDSINVLSVYPRYAFHPRDHVFLGTKDELDCLFNIPLDEERGAYNEWEDVRTETYIGVRYYSLFNKHVQRMIDNPKEYLTDKSPGRGEALRLTNKLIREKLGFSPWPEFPIDFPKHYPNGYPFDFLKDLYGETYA